MHIYLLITILLLSPLLAQKVDLQSLSERLKKLEILLAKQNNSQEQNYDITFPGQYRSNFYSVDNDRDNESKQNAARLRIRQNIDIKFSDTLQTSVRFQLNHTNDNITNADDANNRDVQVRHAHLNYQHDNTKLKMGLVPVQESYNDVLYSKDWGYNPFGIEGFQNFKSSQVHYFFVNLNEGDEKQVKDDFTHYHVDYSYLYNAKTTLTFSVSHMNVLALGEHQNIALKIETPLAHNIKFNSF